MRRQARLANMPNDIHRQIQALLVANNAANAPNNRTLAMLAVAGARSIPRTVPHVSGLRNAFALVTAVADVFRRRHMTAGPGFSFTGELQRVTSRFGLPPLAIQQRASGEGDHFMLVSHGDVRNPGTLEEFPAVTFASDDSPLAVALKLSHRARTNKAELRILFQWRSADLVFQHKFKMFVFSYDRHLAPVTERRYNTYSSNLKARALDIPLMFAVLRCMMDMSLARDNDNPQVNRTTLGLAVKVDRNPAATALAVQAINAAGYDVVPNRTPLPGFLRN